MKNIIYKLGFFLTLILLFSGCQDDDYTFGELVVPNNIDISLTYLDNTDDTTPEYEESVAPGLGSGRVVITATADKATSYHIVVQNITKLAKGGSVSHDFTELGLVTYNVTVIAYGTGGASSSKTFEIEVLSLYAPPADLITMLTADSSRSWKIASEVNKHFGLGPVGGTTVSEWYGAAPNEKDGLGMYDDRYIFNVDGTFTHVTNGDVFGRIDLIDELGGSGGTVNGADVENYLYNDYTAQWTLTAPGGVETLSLTGLAFTGYYTGGNHQYIIHSRSDNEMILTTTDGNNEFNWWFTLIPE